MFFEKIFKRKLLCIFNLDCEQLLFLFGIVERAILQDIGACDSDFVNGEDQGHKPENKITTAMLSYTNPEPRCYGAGAFSLVGWHSDDTYMSSSCYSESILWKCTLLPHGSWLRRLPLAACLSPLAKSEWHAPVSQRKITTACSLALIKWKPFPCCLIKHCGVCFSPM